jgi:hypothetical protein
MSSIPATPLKLRNGDWGAKAQSADVSAGDTLTITTRSGKSWQARVDRVVWTGDDVAICATSSLDRVPRYSRDECCGYRCPVTGRRCTPSDPCHDCQ